MCIQNKQEIVERIKQAITSHDVTHSRSTLAQACLTAEFYGVL